MNLFKAILGASVVGLLAFSAFVFSHFLVFSGPLPDAQQGRLQFLLAP